MTQPQRVRLPLLGLLYTIAHFSVAAATDIHYASEIWTGNGQVIENGALVVDDGKIIAVGPRSEIECPEGSEIYDHGPGILFPGLILAQTNLAENGQDEDEALTPGIEAVDGFNFFGNYENLLASGVTTVQVSPGNQRIMPGQGSIIKLAGDDLTARVIRDSESLRILLTESAFNPPRLYTPPVGAVSVDRPLEPTRPQLAGNLTDAVTGLKALFMATKLPNADSDPILHSLRESLANRQPFRFTVRSAAEIAAAWRLVEEFQLPAIFVGVDHLRDAANLVPWSHESILGIILEGETGFATLRELPTKEDQLPEETWAKIARLRTAGALSKTALTISNRNLDDLWFLAARCRAAGINAQELLSLMTANPAKIMAIDDFVGTLTEGKDADFVVMRGRPFTRHGRVEATYINGKAVFQRQSQDQVIVVHAAAIQTPDGLLKNAQMVVSNGRIRDVGVSISAPANALHIDFAEGVIVPGFIDTDLRIGTGGPLTDRLPLNQQIGNWLAADDPATALVRQGGITTGLLASTNRPSPVVAFKLTNKPRILADPVAFRYAVGDNLTAEESTIRGQLKSAKSYAENWQTYETAYAEYTKQLAEYEKAKTRYDAAVAEAKKRAESKEKGEQVKDNESPTDNQQSAPTNNSDPGKSTQEPNADTRQTDPPTKPATTSNDEPTKDEPATAKENKLVEPKKPEEPKKPQKNDALDATRPLIEGKIPAIVDVNNALKAQLALKLFVDEFNLKLILSASGNTYLEAERIARKNVSVVLTPPLEIRIEGEAVHLAEVFRRSGVNVIVASGAGTGAKNLSLALAHATFHGLGTKDALLAITTFPAELLDLPSIGTIASHQDADFVVYSGPAFEPASKIVAVMIDGHWVYRSDLEALEYQE